MRRAGPALAAACVAIALTAPGSTLGAHDAGAPAPRALNDCTITQDRSLTATQASSIEFINQTQVAIEILWLDYSGNRQSYGTIPPRESRNQPTYITHPWIVLDPSGTCIGYVISDQPHKQYAVRTSTPPPTPPPPPPPSTPPPQLTRPALSGPQTQSAAAGTVVVFASCDRPCTLSATGTVSVPGAAARALAAPARVYRLRRASARLARAGRARLSPAIPAGARRASRRAVARGRRVVATVTVRARYASGSASARRRITLTRSASRPPTPARPRIRTAVGTLAITAVQLGDRFPPGCTLGTPICQRAQAGFQVLTVWLARTDGGNPGGIADRLDTAARGSYVLASNGSRGELAAGGLLSGRLFVAYTPRAGARGFRLYWPGNRPIALGK
jgi:hypothetical protein